MKLPEKFQMRVEGDEGFTHSCAVTGDRVKVKWARGWHEHRQENPIHDVDADLLWTTCDVWQAEKWVRDGGWIVVEEPEQKKQEDALPDVFQFQGPLRAEVYTAKWVGSVYSVRTEYGERKYYRDAALQNIRDGVWKVVRPLTAEQQRANKEIREQIEALKSSIRISEQNVEHQNRLQANYRERIEQLKLKIVETK